MNARQAAAARLLLNLSALHEHPHVSACIEPDGWLVDWDRLAAWNWSSGEKILVELLRTIILGHGHVIVGDLWTLDDENRHVAAQAIATLFSLEQSAGWVE